MKKIVVIAGVVLIGMVVVSCSDVRRDPGHVYMPDMAYSRAYETYAEVDSNKFTTNANEVGEGKIFYNSLPVTGTVARGDMPEFPIAKDKAGDTTNYFASKSVTDPIVSMSDGEKTEAERLYLVNCAICHGPKLDGNGPLWKGGEGPYPAAPRNFMSDPVVTNMPPGQMFYSVTYGKNAMGSYASQLSTKQRWMVISYIKSKQAGTSSGATTAAKTDSTATTGK
ncbi:MAG: cytochrome c [Bacteroidetes bacterium]|nr:cytochrome c [Bacteroidota bacterium]